MTFGSLFSGIGGMDLGLERAGMTCKWQVEIDPFCRRVLAKHWPGVPRHEDIKDFPHGNIEQLRVDLIAGGFPCQDVSDAGLRAGISGARSGLWMEFARVIRELRPRYVLVENTPGLLHRGIDRVLGDMAEIGLDAEWTLLSAAQFGANHIRQRLFVLAYPRGERLSASQILDHAKCPSVPSKTKGRSEKEIWQSESCRSTGRSGRTLPDAECFRVADGFPTTVDRERIKALGNAVVPQVAEFIGCQILAAANPLTDKPSALLGCD